jgi:hypothetical protein
MAPVPLEHRWVFWEADADQLDTGAHGDYLLGRILEFGDMAAVRWAIDTFGMERIHRFFRDVGHVEISERTKRFWRAVFQAWGEPWADPGAWRKSTGAPWID